MFVMLYGQQMAALWFFLWKAMTNLNKVRIYWDAKDACNFVHECIEKRNIK